MIWRALLLLPALLLDSAVTILGWLIVPALAALGRFNVRRSLVFPDRYVVAWKDPWAFWWGNEEDGVDGAPLSLEGYVRFRNVEWWRHTADWSQFRRIVVWAAFRNGASNLRYTRLGLRIIPKRVVTHYVSNGLVSKWFVSCGWRSNFWYQGAKWRFWIGWPIRPWDRDVWTTFLPSSDPRYYGVGFKLQFKRAR